MAGKTETFEDKLRSILAQFEYAKTVREYHSKRTPFQTYMYVPEKHPDTNEVFYEREDDKVTKLYITYVMIQRIASHTRSGGPDKLKLERYLGALQDPASSLTCPAVTGS